MDEKSPVLTAVNALREIVISNQTISRSGYGLVLGNIQVFLLLFPEGKDDIYYICAAAI